MPARSGTSSSSMNTTASDRSSWLESSPSRHSPNRNGGRSTHRRSIIRDPYDSPSRQAQIDYNLSISLADLSFNEKLDQAALARAKLHAEQLARAAAEHERVQRGAELEIQRILLEQEQEKRRREKAQREELERLNRERQQAEEEQQRRELEAKQREADAARQATERQRQMQEADARIKAQKQQEEAAQRQRAEAEQKQRDAAAAAAEARKTQTPAQPPIPATAIPSTKPVSSSTAPGVEELHQKYIDLHARMKQFRKDFVAKHKVPGDPLKEAVGETRRTIRKRLGQITTDRKDSKAAMAALRSEVFAKAVQTPGPTIDIRPFIVSQDIPPLVNEQEAQFPSLLLYAFICFEKFVINQWAQEAANEEGAIISELGLIAASLYADPQYMWKNTVPLTDTVLAKLHRKAPMLFGVRGDPATAAGARRLALDSIGADDASQNAYAQRMRGIGAGFASMSLRQFSSKIPAIPAGEYWRAVVSLCNTPGTELHAGHFMLLHGLLKEHVKKFVMFYGQAAKGVVRRAVRELPGRVPGGREKSGVREAANLVGVLGDGWRKGGFGLEF